MGSIYGSTFDAVAVPAMVSIVSASFFDVVHPRGVPMSGRWFVPDEDKPGAAIPVVVKTAICP